MYKLLTQSKLVKAFFVVTLTTMSQSISAEDIEIFANDIPPSESNILVVLDNSGSMETLIQGTSKTRMLALTEAVEAFTSDPQIKDVNIGLMGFSNGNDKPRPHGVSVPISPIDDEVMPIMLSNIIPESFSTGSNFGYFDLSRDNLPDPVAGQTVRSYLPQVVGAWQASGGTPIVDALHEAALYFRGLPPKWGAVSAEQVNAAHPSTYTGQILATALERQSGRTEICNQPDCGNSCVPIIKKGKCKPGETSCWTGNNCSTDISKRRKRCDLGDATACLIQNPQYESCRKVTESECTTKCNGPKDPETGACLGDKVSTCTDSSFFRCELTDLITSCDRQKYQCGNTKITKTNTGSATYNSPITDQCQSNTLVLLTDGAPNVSGQQDAANQTRDEIRLLLGGTSDCSPVDGQVIPSTVSNTLADGRCGAELVSYLATEDQSASIEGTNIVKTYTVGFAVDDRPDARSYLQSLAKNGGGKYFPANDSEALVKAFTSIFNESAPTDRSFATPVYTVDPSSKLSHSNDIYLPLFKNSALPGWSGNLKKL